MGISVKGGDTLCAGCAQKLQMQLGRMGKKDGKEKKCAVGETMKSSDKRDPCPSNFDFVLIGSLLSGRNSKQEEETWQL